MGPWSSVHDPTATSRPGRTHEQDPACRRDPLRTSAGPTDPALIRNFCIIAHIDHGKSTLADRMLQLTGVVDQRQMRAQYLDRMDIERERGITIKCQAVRLPWTVREGERAGEHAHPQHDRHPGARRLHLRGQPQSLAACEGAVLLVDAAQGIEAQTLANLYLAMENDLTIIPVLNKIDLPAAQPEKYAEELAHLIGCEPDDVPAGLRQDRRGRDAPARRDRPADAGRRSATPTRPPAR